MSDQPPTSDAPFAVESDTIEIAANTVHPATGDRLEPEEVMGRRVLGGAGPVTFQGSDKVQGSIPVSISYEAPAAQLAQGFRNTCGLCRNFDQRAWHAYFRKLSSSVDGIRILNQFRFGLVASENAAVVTAHEDKDGDLDVEHAMMACGLCRPLTEEMMNPIIVYPASSCPQYLLGTNGQPDETKPFPNSFVPKDLEAEKRGSKMFDQIMQKAQQR